jgi:lipopolysaccharide/colanic/teichoic acid biosynthesis glycosyltransferase
VFATCGFVCLAFPFLAIFAFVIISSPGPVFFTQRRVGRGGRPFTCVKFRTMYVGAKRHGSVTTSDDHQVTPLGRVLRRFKLDEFPQLWNVIIGHMSFVGPRPDVPGYADKLQGEERRILDLRPGITGPATIAFRNEEAILASVPDAMKFNDTVIYPLKVKLNLMYLDQFKFWKDISYIFATIFPSLSKRWGLNRRLKIMTITDPEMAVDCLRHLQEKPKSSEIMSGAPLD